MPPPRATEPSVPVAAKKRATVVLFFFVLWTVIVTGRLAQFMIFQRSQYLQDMNREAVIRREIPGRRGRLFDRNGKLLAWSTRHVSAHWLIPTRPRQAQSQRGVLQRTFPGTQLPSADEMLLLAGKTICLDDDLSPARLAELGALEFSSRHISFSSRFVRHRCSEDPEALAIIGEVDAIDGVTVGVSGMERTHDAILRGETGVYEVMVDRGGTWLNETWQKVRDMRPGYDVYLSVRVAEAGGGPLK